MLIVASRRCRLSDLLGVHTYTGKVVECGLHLFRFWAGPSRPGRGLLRLTCRLKPVSWLTSPADWLVVVKSCRVTALLFLDVYRRPSQFSELSNRATAGVALFKPRLTIATPNCNPKLHLRSYTMYSYPLCIAHFYVQVHS